MGSCRLSFLIISLVSLLVLFANNVSARETLKADGASSPAFIEADAMFYDQKTGIVTAEGHVEIIQSGRMLLADKVVYNQNTNQVDAYGDISLLETDGTTLFAEEAELRDGLKEGVIKYFSARMQKDALFVADSATRVEGNKTILLLFKHYIFCSYGKV